MIALCRTLASLIVIVCAACGPAPVIPIQTARLDILAEPGDREFFDDDSELGGSRPPALEVTFRSPKKLDELREEERYNLWASIYPCVAGDETAGVPGLVYWEGRNITMGVDGIPPDGRARDGLFAYTTYVAPAPRRLAREIAQGLPTYYFNLITDPADLCIVITAGGGFATPARSAPIVIPERAITAALKAAGMVE